MESLELAQHAYEQGRIAFEHGEYRESIAALESAQTQVGALTPLGGEIQIWLVTAYEAAGKRSEARSLCETLVNHPHGTTRRQARRWLEILKAPQLQRRAEWNTQIPDWSTLSESDRRDHRGTGVTPSKTPPALAPEEEVPVAPTADNGFVWVALIAIGLIIGGWIGWVAAGWT